MSFYEQLWLFNGEVENSTVGGFFHQVDGTECGSTPPLTTRDRELVSVLEVGIEPGDFNPRLLTPQSVTLPILPRAGVRVVGGVTADQHLNWKDDISMISVA